MTRSEVGRFCGPKPGAMLTLLTGPVRSGKSAFAARLARESGAEPCYVATAVVDHADPEMVARIARHRADRGSMNVVETNEATGPRLVEVLARAASSQFVIVDSLGTWLSSQLVALDSQSAAAADMLERSANELLDALAMMKTDAVVVAEETGWGVVPPYPLGRLFRDQLGRMTAALAGRADRAYLVVAGFAVDLHAVGRRVSAP